MKSPLITATVTLLVLTGALWLHGSPQVQHQATVSTIAQTTAEQSPRVRTGPSETASTPAPLAAAPHTVGAPTANPSTIVVNTPTLVTVSVSIADPALIAGSVNLLRLDTTGTQPKIVGTMQNSGSGIYSIQTTFNEATAGQIQLETSAAFRGALQRVFSTPLSVNIWNSFANNAAAARYTLAYPPGWVTASGTSSSEEYFSPLGSMPDTSSEYVADIVVDSAPNPNALDLNTYYTTVAEVNLFQNCQSFSTFTTANGFPAVRFINVEGMIPTDVIAVNIGKAIIEINDVGEQHQDDGVAQSVANSVR
jgi:hypothetical protein